MTDTYETIGLSIGDDGLATLSLNRPERLNAFTSQMLSELADAVERINSTPHSKVVVVRGEGRAFCSGRDRDELNETVSHSHGGVLPLPGGHESSMLGRIEVPTIAVLRGAVVGGGLGFALQCDIRVAAADTRLVDGHLGSGMVSSLPSWFLPRLGGMGAAYRVLCSPKGISASEAQAFGLVDVVVEADELGVVVKEWVELFLQWAPELLRHSKRLLLTARQESLASTMELVGYLRSLRLRGVE